MQLARSDLFGGICAGLALCLIVWLSLDSWAITRCQEILSEMRSRGGRFGLAGAGEMSEAPESAGDKGKLAVP
ncbi:MAG: hypothetical protein R3B94_10710 [Hyphomonas sp.]